MKLELELKFGNRQDQLLLLCPSSKWGPHFPEAGLAALVLQPSVPWEEPVSQRMALEAKAGPARVLCRSTRKQAPGCWLKASGPHGGTIGYMADGF